MNQENTFPMPSSERGKKHEAKPVECQEEGCEAAGGEAQRSVTAMLPGPRRQLTVAESCTGCLCPFTCFLEQTLEEGMLGFFA